MAHSDIETVCIAHLAVIVAEHLVVKVTEQVEWLDRNIGSAQAALDQGPEVFKPIGVDFAAHILDRMGNYFMLKFAQAFI